jgi:hypothetical protein
MDHHASQREVLYDGAGRILIVSLGISVRYRGFIPEIQTPVLLKEWGISRPFLGPVLFEVDAGPVRMRRRLASTVEAESFSQQLHLILEDTKHEYKPRRSLYWPRQG